MSYTFKFATSQTSKNFQNKNEFEKSPKKEEGDAKLVFCFVLFCFVLFFFNGPSFVVIE